MAGTFQITLGILRELNNLRIMTVLFSKIIEPG